MDDPRALGIYLKSGFVSRIPAGLVEAVMDGFEGDPRRLTAVFTQQGGGAIGRVPAHATAFAQRDVLANLLVVTGWPHGSDPAEHMERAGRYWEALEPHTHGFYVNDLEPELSATAVRENYRENHARLVAVKNRYDPRNLFRLNANVEPTVTP